MHDFCDKPFWMQDFSGAASAMSLHPLARLSRHPPRGGTYATAGSIGNGGPSSSSPSSAEGNSRWWRIGVSRLGFQQVTQQGIASAQEVNSVRLEESQQVTKSTDRKVENKLREKARYNTTPAATSRSPAPAPPCRNPNPPINATNDDHDHKWNHAHHQREVLHDHADQKQNRLQERSTKSPATDRAGTPRSHGAQHSSTEYLPEHRNGSTKSFNNVDGIFSRKKTRRTDDGLKPQHPSYKHLHRCRIQRRAAWSATRSEQALKIPPVLRLIGTIAATLTNEHTCGPYRHLQP